MPDEYLCGVIPKTIAALATAKGLGALHVVRVSGPDALRIAQHVFRITGAWTPRKALLGVFCSASGEDLDQGLATWFAGPASFTGEDVVEFGLHGSSYIAEEALNALRAAGAELAAPGEFTQRAFANGKLDLTQAEAVGDLIAAESRAGHELALKQLKGTVSHKLQELRTRLTDFAALIELELDFVEEDVEFAQRDQLLEVLADISTECETMLSTFRHGRAVRDGIPLVLLGAPNAGKSTLLNRLLRDDRALVSAVPGTTRDSVEERFRLGDYVFRLVDTAGIRATEDPVEQMGIARSWTKLAEAHLALVLVDPTQTNADEAQELYRRVRQSNPEAECIVLLTKRDLWGSLEGAGYPEHLAIGPSQDDLAQLEWLLLETIRRNEPKGNVLIANARHAAALEASLESLKRVRSSLELGISGELVAYDLRDALRHLGSITGEVTADDLLGSIFSSFCIGK
jgi:tRNA modification GTPase